MYHALTFDMENETHVINIIKNDNEVSVIKFPVDVINKVN